MKNVLRKIPAILVMAALFTLSTLPGNDPILNSVHLSDKIEHFIAYFVLGITFCIWIPSKNWFARPVFYGVLVIVLCTLFGISDEYHQTFVPERSGDLYDLTVDFVASVSAVFAYFLFIKKIKK
ncbi:MAG: VanZ family protein [Fibromonadaceae bacterium]|jgi:VanZ family protein|nr:VanZ family protein [Fibromonadaceae bacterium]